MPDSQLFTLIIAGCIMFLLFGIFTVYMIRYLMRRNATYLSEKEKMRHEWQNSLVEESERLLEQISRRVHDDILQPMSLARTYLYTIKSQATDEKQLKRIEDVSEIADQILKDASNISQSLNSDFMKNTPLPTLLKNELVRSCGTKLAHYVKVRGNVDGIDAEKKLFIYRIAQDAITNVVQHSCASSIEILLVRKRDRFSMRIMDNGLGIPQDRLHVRYGVGMNNMKQRAKYLGGRLHISSEPGQGCKVSLQVHHVNFDYNN